MNSSQFSLNSNDMDLSRSEIVYRKIKQQIISSEFPSGYHELEPALAQRMGVSRTPVREALVRLAAEKFIELIPRRGMKVLALERKDIAETHQVLTSLNSLVAELISKSNNVDSHNLRQALDSIESALAAKDQEAWLVAEDDFYFALLSLAGSHRLVELVSDLRVQYARAKRVLTKDQNFLSGLSREYAKMSACIEQKNWNCLREAFESTSSLTVKAMYETFNEVEELS